MSRSDQPVPVRRAGFTLIEMTISLSLIAVLVVGLGSAVMIAARAVPSASAPAVRVPAARAAIADLADDLQAAMHLTETAPSAVQMTVADRDGDGRPEVIRYAWEGADGDPITRTLNAGTPVPVVEDVATFDLTWDPVTGEETFGEVANATSSEQQMSVFDAGGTGYNLGITAMGRYATPIAADLPTDATAWTITRARIYARQNGSTDGIVPVQIRTGDVATGPSDTVLAEVLVDEADLTGSFSWHEIVFPDPPVLAPTDTAFLVLSWQAGAQALRTKGTTDPAGGRFFESWNGGGTWDVYVDEALYHDVYGTVTVAMGKEFVERRFHATVGATVGIAGDPPTSVSVPVLALNAPEVLDVIRETDFSADPATLDLDGDGSPDWGHVDGTPIGPGLENGAWWAEGAVETIGAGPFEVLTTVDVRLRDLAADGAAGGVRMYVDDSGDAQAVIDVAVTRQADGTQSVIMSTYGPDLVWTDVIRVDALTGGWIDLRIMVDPVGDVVSLGVGGVLQTARYGRVAPVSPPVIRVYHDGIPGGMQVDHARVRVGGAVQ